MERERNDVMKKKETELWREKDTFSEGKDRLRPLPSKSPGSSPLRSTFFEPSSLAPTRIRADSHSAAKIGNHSDQAYNEEVWIARSASDQGTEFNEYLLYEYKSANTDT
jgi:hypothetical protein